MFASTFASNYRRTEEEEREYKRRRAEAARRRRQNLSDEQKAAERERNAAAARQRRLHQTEEQRAAERERHRARRANPQVRAAERERDAEARRRRRANPHLRAAERARRRERRLAEGVRPSYRRQRRAKARRDRRQTSERRRASASPTPAPAVWSRGAGSEDDFTALLLDDLGQLCSACDRLCFRHDVSEVSPRHVATLAREFPDEENVEDFALCQACRDSLEAGSVALVARRCGYVYPPMPDWLTIISSDEEEQPIGCVMHGPAPVLAARSTQTDVIMPLSRRVDIAIGPSWIDNRSVSRSTQTQTSSSIAAKVHSWTATEMDDLPKRRSFLRKRASAMFNRK